MAADQGVRVDRVVRLQFETTRWSLVDRARTDDGHEALNDLLERLWGPVYAWLRRSGRSEEGARDLTQGFRFPSSYTLKSSRNSDTGFTPLTSR